MEEMLPRKCKKDPTDMSVRLLEVEFSSHTTAHQLFPHRLFPPRTTLSLQKLLFFCDIDNSATSSNERPIIPHHGAEVHEVMLARDVLQNLKNRPDALRIELSPHLPRAHLAVGRHVRGLQRGAVPADDVLALVALGRRKCLRYG